MSTVYTEECGGYVLDCPRLLLEITKAVTQIREQTNRNACAIDLHQADALELAQRLGGNGEHPVTFIGGILVLLNESADRRRGVAQVLLCDLPHPMPLDCPYHARTTRRLVSRDIPVSIQMPMPPNPTPRRMIDVGYGEQEVKDWLG